MAGSAASMSDSGVAQGESVAFADLIRLLGIACPKVACFNCWSSVSTGHVR